MKISSPPFSWQIVAGTVNKYCPLSAPSEPWEKPVTPDLHKTLVWLVPSRKIEGKWELKQFTLPQFANTIVAKSDPQLAQQNNWFCFANRPDSCISFGSARCHLLLTQEWQILQEWHQGPLKASWNKLGLWEPCLWLYYAKTDFPNKQIIPKIVCENVSKLMNKPAD